MPTKRPEFLAESIEDYLEYCRALGQTNRTIEGKRSSLDQFKRWCQSHGLVRLAELSKASIDEYQRDLSTFRQPRNGRALDLATQRNRLTTVKVFLRYLADQGMIESNPAARIRLPRCPRRLPAAHLTVPQIECVLACALASGRLHAVRDRAILETFYATGIRRMELANLDLSDLHTDRGLLLVRQGKGRKDRFVPIADRAIRWIGRYLGSVRPRLVATESAEALFLDDRGKRLRGSQLTALVARNVKQAGIRVPGACKLFRHATATLMLENGADLRHIQKILGHADISTTQIYAHVTSRSMRRVYNATHPAAQS